MKEKPVKRFEAPYTDYEMTREEIGDRLGVSRQTIADIEKKALLKLRRALRKRGIDKDDFV